MKKIKQYYALARAKEWHEPTMVTRYALEAHKIKPLTEMQWWHLQVVHGPELIDQIKKQAGVNL